MSKYIDTQLGEMAVNFMCMYNMSDIRADIMLQNIQLYLPYAMPTEAILQRINNMATRHIDNE